MRALDHLLMKSLDLLFRLFSADEALFEEASRALLHTEEEAVKFADYVETHVPLVRRLAHGYIEHEDLRLVLRLNVVRENHGEV